jgi:hypothetical protein
MHSHRKDSSRVLAQLQYRIRQISTIYEELQLVWTSIEWIRNGILLKATETETIGLKESGGRGMKARDTNRRQVKPEREREKEVVKLAVRTMIDCIRRGLGWSLNAIGDAVGSVAESNVSRWHSGEALPTEGHMQKLRELFEAARSRLYADFYRFSLNDFEYVGSFAGDEGYTTELRSHALNVLRDTLPSFAHIAVDPQSVGIHIDVHIRRAKHMEPANAPAHCYVLKSIPCVIYIIVNERLTMLDQVKTAFDELYGHFLPEFYAGMTQTRHPERLIG